MRPATGSSESGQASPPRMYSRQAAPIFAAGSVLALLTLAVPDYWRTTWWALACAAVLALGPGAGALAVRRHDIPGWAIVPLMLLADCMVVAAAPCVRDQHRAGTTIVLFALPTVIAALFGSGRTLAAQTVAVAVGAALVLHLAGDPTPVLVLHDLLAVFGTVSPAATVLALRRHLDAAVLVERRLATTDPLTAATNRWGIEAAVTRAAMLAARRGLPVGVMVLDVDHFKRINDEYGHPVGDEVLRRVAGAVRACIRAEDDLVRLGGEEFAVLAVLGPRDLTRLAERVRLHVRARCAAWGLTASIGVAWGDVDPAPDAADGTPSGGPVEQLWALIGRADGGLLEAKRAGRDRLWVVGGPGATIDLSAVAPAVPVATGAEVAGED